MADIDFSGKVAYIYDEGTSKWYALSGAVNTAAAYEWTGTQIFGSSVSFEDVVKAKAGINNFQNPAARDLAISSPTNGIVCFVRQDANGSVINEIQYYYNGSWRSNDDAIKKIAKTSNHTLQLSDAGKTIIVTSSDPVVITVPSNSSVPFIVGQKIEIIRNGSGGVSIGNELGVSIHSKFNNKNIAAQYSGAILVKDDTNTWILIGDLMA